MAHVDFRDEGDEAAAAAVRTGHEALSRRETRGDLGERRPRVDASTRVMRRHSLVLDNSQVLGIVLCHGRTRPADAQGSPVAAASPAVPESGGLRLRARGPTAGEGVRRAVRGERLPGADPTRVPGTARGLPGPLQLGPGAQVLPAHRRGPRRARPGPLGLAGSGRRGQRHPGRRRRERRVDGRTPPRRHCHDVHRLRRGHAHAGRHRPAHRGPGRAAAGQAMGAARRWGGWTGYGSPSPSSPTTPG